MEFVPVITQEHIKATGEVFGLSSAEWLAEVCNKALEIALAEQPTQEQFITVEQARALGENNAEFQTLLEPYEWILCDANCQYRYAYNYRAIKKEAPTEPHVYPTCQVRNDDTGVTETMTRESAQKLQAETKDVCDWFFPNEAKAFDTEIFAFDDKTDMPYFYKLKTNLVKLDGKLVTREAAVAEWESKKDTCDVWYRSDAVDWCIAGIYLIEAAQSLGSEYQLRTKALKQVRWGDMAVGVMTDKGELRKVIYSRHVEGAKMQIETNQNASTANVSEFYSPKDLTLAPADQQNWLNWRGGDCPVPEGVIVEVTLRSGSVKRHNEVDDWTHKVWGASTDIIEYRVVGIADGWELK